MHEAKTSRFTIELTDQQIQKSVSLYRTKYLQKFKGTETEELFYDLLAQFKKTDKPSISLNDIQIKIADSGLPYRETAAKIVNFGYKSRYLKNGENNIDLARDHLDNFSTTKTLVATQQIDDSPVVLSTFRCVTGDQLEIFRLFEMWNGDSWPHQLSKTFELKPGELGRFANHPILDVLGASGVPRMQSFASNLKRELLQMMWPFGMAIMASEGVKIPYFILAPSVYKFVVQAGILPQQIEGAIANHSRYSQDIRKKFASYWRPDEPIENQPAAYLAPMEVVQSVWRSS